MNRWQTFTRAVLPPALKRAWPSLVSQFVIAMLGASVSGQISTQALRYAADLIQRRNFCSFEAFIGRGVLGLGLLTAADARIVRELPAQRWPTTRSRPLFLAS